MKKLVISLFLIPLMLLFSCGGKKSHDELTESAPNWVNKGSGAFKADDKGSVLYGVGVMSKNPNVSLQRQTADARARNELAKILNTYVGSLIKDFMSSHQDYTKPEASGSVEFVSVITKTVTDATLVGSEIIDHWMDKDGNLYSLAYLSFENVAKVIQDRMNEAIRDKQGKFLESKANEAMTELNSELDKRKENP